VRREQQPQPDPKTMPPDEYRAVRDLIERNVTAWLASLAV
jgi:hypothetical protein